MKKTYILYILLLTTITWNNNFAQTTSIGIKGGLQFSSFEGSPFNNGLTAFNAGASFINSSMENWGWGVDLLYSRNGGRYSFLREDKEVQNFVFVDYIRLNPRVYYFFRGIEDAFRPKIFLGPGLGMVTQVYDIDTELSYLRHFELLSFELMAGTGFNYKLRENLWLTFDIDYLLGLTNVNTIPLITPSENIRNNGFSVTVGLTFGIAGRAEVTE